MSGKVAVHHRSSRGIVAAPSPIGGMPSHGGGGYLVAQAPVCDEVAKAINDKAGKQGRARGGREYLDQDDLQALLSRQPTGFSARSTALVCNAASIPIGRRREFPTTSFVKESGQQHRPQWNC